MPGIQRINSQSSLEKLDLSASEDRNSKKLAFTTTKNVYLPLNAVIEHRNRFTGVNSKVDCGSNVHSKNLLLTSKPYDKSARKASQPIAVSNGNLRELSTGNLL